MASGKCKINMKIDNRTRFLNYLRKHIVDIYYDVCKDTVHIGYNYALKIAKQAVEIFYSEYTPLKKGYKRTGDLRNAFQVGIRNGYELVFELGSEFMEHWHHQENDFIYWLTFVNGNHGGFPHAGSMYWRTPIPFFTRWYSKPAPFTAPSPREYIVSRWNAFVNDKYIPAQIAEFKKKLSEIKDRMEV